MVFDYKTREKRDSLENKAKYSFWFFLSVSQAELLLS